MGKRLKKDGGKAHLIGGGRAKGWTAGWTCRENEGFLRENVYAKVLPPSPETLDP
jgi:hypothetical protein